MESEPLLCSPTSPTSPNNKWKHHHFLPLSPLPEHQEISIHISSSPTSPSASSLKDLLIFGDPTSPSTSSTSVDPTTWPTSTSTSARPSLHRSRTAPAMSSIPPDPLDRSHHPPQGHGEHQPRRFSLVRQSFLLLSLYLSLGVAIYSLFTSHFSTSSQSHPVVDALYFCIVTMCTIGYGDITPATPFAKLFSISFVLFGFGFIDILLSSMLSYVLDLQESLLLHSLSLHNQNRNRRNYLVDFKKGRMRIRMKVGLALSVVCLCIGVGTAVLAFVERLGCLDAFYLSVMSVTTVGYGDRAFKTVPGRLFASAWLLVSTLAVARAFLYLAEARIDKRHRKIAKWVLARDMTVSEFLAADIDNNGFVSKSEFVIYKLKEMGKIAEKDILQICDQFNKLDTGNCGKITLSDLTEAHHR